VPQRRVVTLGLESGAGRERRRSPGSTAAPEHWWSPDLVDDEETATLTDHDRHREARPVGRRRAGVV